MLIIEPLGGLCNRMLALDGAMALARATRRPLTVIWRLAGHFGASFGDVFEELPGVAAWYEFDMRKTIGRKAFETFVETVPVVRRFDYLEVGTFLDGGGSLAELLQSGPVYVQAISRIHPTPGHFGDFRPVPHLRDRVAAMSASFHETVGVHIRRTDSQPSIDESPTDAFVQRMRELAMRGDARSFFLATDDPREEAALVEAFPGKILHQPKRSLDRDKREAIEDAVVDLYSLAATNQLLGSFYSTFSQTAAAIGRIQQETIRRPQPTPEGATPHLFRAGATVLTFGIPLKLSRDPEEWAQICELLSATVRSIYNQTDPAFRILIACDRRPELSVATDHRLAFLDLDLPRATSFREDVVDASAKRRSLVERFVAEGGGYMMLLDYDDLVSNRLVGYVRTTAHPSGYIFTRGYALDPDSGAVLALPHAEFGDVAFDKICGSSAILRWTDPADVVDDRERPSRYERLLGQGHSKTEAAATAEGSPLLAPPFPGTIHRVDTGASLMTMSSNEDGESATGQRYLKNLINQRGFPSSRIAHEFGFAKPAEHQVPSLSVVIATFGRPAGLRRLLAVLVPQVERMSGREIIVVNDGSTEAEYEAVSTDYAGIVRYHALPKNRGVAAARNVGADLATGDFVVYVDDDCEPPAWWLDWLLALLVSEPDLDVVAGTTKPLWPRRKSFMARVEAHFRFTPQPIELDRVVLFVTANVAIRRSLLVRLGGFGFPGFSGTGEDTELANRLALAGAAVRVDPDWHVAHEVGAGLRRLCRRFWRYGHGNGAAARLTTTPIFDRSLLGYRRRQHLTTFVARYRHHREQARGFSSSRLMQAASAAAASLISLAYLDGWAAAIAGRDRPPD